MGDTTYDKLLKVVQQVNQKFYDRENAFVIFLHLESHDRLIVY